MKDAQKVRSAYLIRNIMTAWYILLPELRAENAKLERISERLINDFRKVKSHLQLGNCVKKVFL